MYPLVTPLRTCVLYYLQEAERLVFSHKRASSMVTNDVQGFKVGSMANVTPAGMHACSRLGRSLLVPRK
jgi:hypothetical protein